MLITKLIGLENRIHLSAAANKNTLPSRTDIKGWKKSFQTNEPKKQVGIAILIYDKKKKTSNQN